LLAIAALVGFPCRSVGAQAATDRCDYARCSLDIVPRLAGLAVVRGAPEQRVATLPFLWPARVAPVFGDDSVARAHAVKATRRRALAAVLTDVGAVLAIVGASRSPRAAHSAVAVGAAIVAVSVPIQFA